MSTSRSMSRVRLWFSGIVVVAGLAFAGLSWDGFDGRSPPYDAARLLTEGASGSDRWTVVQVHVPDSGDCLHLRRQGVLLGESCRSANTANDYQVEALTLPGTGQRFVFGMLPAGAARAEIVPGPAGTTRSPLPVRVFTYGTSGRYVAEVVSAEPAASSTTEIGSTLIAVKLYDAQGHQLRP